MQVYRKHRNTLQLRFRKLWPCEVSIHLPNPRVEIYWITLIGNLEHIKEASISCVSLYMLNIIFGGVLIQYCQCEPT